MRYSFLIIIAMSLGACASSNKGAPAPATPPSEQITPTNTAPTAKGDNLPAPTPETSKVACVHAKDSRVLELRAKVKGCELGYTKGGKESVVATSVNGTQHCADKMTSIKNKLVAAGFTCQ